MHRSDVIAICSFVVALGAGIGAGSPLATALDTVTLGHGQYALSVLALASLTAGCILRVLNNPKSADSADQKGS